MKKRNKSSSNQKLTSHHILPTSAGGISGEANIKKLGLLVHRSLHHIFHNETPTEQLQHLMFGINVQVLTEEFKNDIKKILSETDSKYYYKEGILRPNYK